MARTNRTKIATPKTTTKKPKQAVTKKAAAKPRRHLPTITAQDRRRRALHLAAGWSLLGVAVIMLGFYATSAQVAAMGEQALTAQHYAEAKRQLSLAQHVFPLVPREAQLQQVDNLEQSHQYYLAGLSAFHNKQWQAAGEIFQRVVQADPNYLSAQTYLQNSRQLQQKAHQQSTDLLNEARQFLASKDFSGASKVLQSISPADEGYQTAIQLQQALKVAESEQKEEELQHLISNQSATLEVRQLHVPILMYHYISTPPNQNDAVRVDLSVTPEMFDRQMSYLAANAYHTVTMPEMDAALLGKGTLPPKPIVLTFDDGYRDFYENAYPILRKYHLKATIYVVTNFADNPAYLNWDMIKTMISSGLISVGSHTLNHADLPYKSGEEVVRQVTESKKIIEQHIGQPVTSFCYPYGGHNDQVVAAVRQAGYLDATTTLPGSWHTSNDLLTLTRVRIKNHPMSGYLSE